MKNLLLFAFLLLTGGACAQNDSILPNVFGQYTVQQDLWDDSGNQYVLNMTFVNETPGEDTLEVYDNSHHVARIALDGYKAYIKQTEYAIETHYFINPTLGEGWFGDGWEILYDFSLEVGDSGCFHYGSVLTVTSIDTIYVQGEPRKVLHLDGGGQEQWIQGVGSNWHPLAPKRYYFENGEKLCGAALTYDGPSSVDSSYYSQPCSITGTVERGDRPLFEIHPNPASDWIYITPAEVQHAEIRIYDMYGRVVYRGKAQNETTRVSTTGLAAGAYVVRVSAGVVSSVQKVVV